MKILMLLLSVISLALNGYAHKAPVVGPAPDAPGVGPPVEAFPYSMVAAPTPKFRDAVVAIVPTENNIKLEKAK